MTDDRLDENSPLGAFVRAARTAPPSRTVDRAQRGLLDRLSNQAPASKTRRGWLAASVMAAMACAAILVAPLITGSNDAFAEVQRHFRNFKILSMWVEQRSGSVVLQRSRMTVDAEGNQRTDVGDELSVIVSPSARTVLTLFHPNREATVAELPPTSESPDAALAWLEKIKAFKGSAKALPGAARIAGVRVQGWELDVNGDPIRLWATPAGMPVAMRAGGSHGVELHFRFQIDHSIPIGYLSPRVPHGYHIVQGEDR